jgi:hypothetical protein
MITHVYDLSSLACRRWEMYRVVVGGGEGRGGDEITKAYCVRINYL